ncbi:hypothetical protein LINPERHAP1_LOCUS10715 [Linum perenne]
MGSYPESILRVGARGGRSEQGDSYFSRTWLVKWKGKKKGKRKKGFCRLEEKKRKAFIFFCVVFSSFFFWVFCFCPFPIA